MDIDLCTSKKLQKKKKKAYMPKTRRLDKQSIYMLDYKVKSCSA